MVTFHSLNQIVSLLDYESKTWERFDQKLIQWGTETRAETR